MKDELERTRKELNEVTKTMLIAEGRSLFHPIHDRANFSASIEYLCQDAERG